MAVRVPTSFLNRPGLKSRSLDTSIEFQSGAIYSGRLEEKSKEGRAVFSWPNGDKYEGEYRNNKRNGNGKQSWSDGDSYEGDYVDDVREGKGTYVWNNGDVYQGHFFRDHRHGFGKYTYADGSVFVGTFYMDRKEGYGLLTYAGPEAEQFAGLYQSDEREGPGVLSYRDGRADVGLWHRERLNRLLTSTADGQGFSIHQFPEVEYFPEEHKLFLNLNEVSEQDPLLEMFGDIVFPPDPLDYDPLATATVREQLGSALRRDTDVQSTGFDREAVDERFAEELDRQSQSGTPCARSASAATTSSAPRTASSSKARTVSADARPISRGISTLPPTPPPAAPIEAKNCSPSSLRQQLHVLRFRRWQESAPLDVDAILTANRSAFPASGPLEVESLRLIAASRVGDMKTARVILDSGIVDPDVTDQHGRTPLIEAAVNWHPEMVNLLLDAGADINRLTDEGLSALSACLLQYYPPSAFKSNIAEESPIVIRAQDGGLGPQAAQTMIGSNQRKKRASVAKAELVEGSGPGKMTTVLEVNESVDDLAVSVDSGFRQESSAGGRFGGLLSSETTQRPTFAAAMERWEFDSAVDTADYFSQRPLYSSGFGPSAGPGEDFSEGDGEGDRYEEDFDSHNSLIDFPIEVSDLLVGRCATALSAIDGVVNRSAAKTPQGRVREMAIQMSRHALMESMLHLLLRRGADPNASKAPMPSLFYPVKAADVEMVHLLLLKGVDANARLSHKRGGLYPIHIAVALPGEDGVKITSLLLDALADPDARADPDDSFLDRLLEEEWSKDFISPEQRSILGGRTALHIACARETDYKNAQKIVRLLMNHHANPNLMCNGHSPISLAIACGNDLALDDLLNNGADPSLVLTHGVGSALCVASSTFYEHRRTVDGRLNLLNRLVKAGADVLAPICIGPKRQPGTAIDYAYAIYNMDRRIAHMPYHALTHSERETFNARRRLLCHLGSLVREKAVDRERLRLEATERMGIQSRGPSPNFVYTGAGATTAKDGAAGGPGSLRRGESRVSFEDPSQLMRQAAELSTRKPMFKYCYECGRSVGVRLTACTRCKEVFYCSKACKLKAWNARHKDECVRVGGRGNSGKNKDQNRIDSPTPATDPERGQRGIGVEGLLRETERTKAKIAKVTSAPAVRSRDKSVKIVNVTSAPAVRSHDKPIKNPMRGRTLSASAASRFKLPPIADRNHPSYSYMYLAGRYVKVDMRERSIIGEPLENYSWE